MKPRVYISHSIRGKAGPTASEEVIIHNNAKAMVFSNWLRTRYPNVEFYVPAEHEDFVHLAYKLGFLTEEQILDIDCRIIGECNAVVLYDHEKELSRGMIVEANYARRNDIPQVIVQEPLMLFETELDVFMRGLLT